MALPSPFNSLERKPLDLFFVVQPIKESKVQETIPSLNQVSLTPVIPSLEASTLAGYTFPPAQLWLLPIRQNGIWPSPTTQSVSLYSAKSSTIDFLKLTTTAQPFGSSANRYCPALTARQVPISVSGSSKLFLLKFGDLIRNGWCYQRAHHRE